MFLLSTLLTACTVSPAATAAVTQTPIQELQSKTVSTYITATSIQELTNKSTIVVIGTAVSTGDVINLARDVNDISKPDPDIFGIGQEYEIEVTRYLKGDQEVNETGTIYLVQFEGIVSHPSQMPPTADDIEKSRANEDYIPIKLGGEYILFLKPLGGFAELKMHFSGIAHPWRFALVNGCAFPESPWWYLRFYFRPQPVEEMIKQIENTRPGDDKIPTTMVYPAPGDGSSSSCQSETDKPIPILYP